MAVLLPRRSSMLAAFSHSASKAPDVGEPRDEITAVFDEERERSARLDRTELRPSPSSRTFEPACPAAPMSSSRAKVPASARFVDDDQLSRLEPPCRDGLVHRREPGAELGRAGQSRDKRGGRGSKRSGPAGPSARGSSPLDQPLGGVLGLDPEARHRAPVPQQQRERDRSPIRARALPPRQL